MIIETRLLLDLDRVSLELAESTNIFDFWLLKFENPTSLDYNHAIKTISSAKILYRLIYPLS